MTLAFAQIEAAAERLKGHIERTPCRHSKTLSQITGAEVWVKFENLQFTASFKERGALNKLLQLNDRNRGVIAASAGNHSQGLAFHGQQLGIPVTIVMPRATPFVKVQQTRDFGAEVVLDGETYEDASSRAQELCEERDLIFVHPFNDVDVMAGQGTIAMEMLEDAPELDILPVPIGGGGLIAGVATAAKHMKPEISVVGVEPASFPSFTARMRGLGPITGGQTIAEGIQVKQVGDLTYAIVRPLIDQVLLVEEPSLERAIALYCNVEKTVCEGAGAASLAALIEHPDTFRGKRVGLILTGGNIDPRLLASVLTRELVREKRLVSLKIVGDDRPGLLANVSAVIGGHGANIVEVAHNRLALDVPAKGAEFDIMIETRDARHTREVVQALKDAALSPEAALRLVRAAAVAAAFLLGACQGNSEAATNLKAAQGFLRLNAQQPGVVSLPSGLEYKIVSSGPAGGPHPGPGDEVKVNYEGKLLDGKVFDSSFQRGEPLDLPLDRVIPGWTEALEHMRPGDEWILYIPPNLGYRDKEAGPIPPNSLLIFRVQLLSILPRQPELG